MIFDGYDAEEPALPFLAINRQLSPGTPMAAIV
jgi:hypothetical protein